MSIKWENPEIYEIDEILRINPDNHNYYLDCKSASDIKEAKYHFPKENIDDEILAKAQEKGTCAHKIAENFINSKGAIRPDECEHGIKAHVQQAKYLINWIRDNHILDIDNILKPELSFVSSIETEKGKIIYTGTTDLAISKTTTLEKQIVDWKTTSKAKKEQEAMQLVLYCKGLGWDPMDTELTIVNGNIKKAYSMSKGDKYKALEDIEEAVNKILDSQIDW